MQEQNKLLLSSRDVFSFYDDDDTTDQFPVPDDNFTPSPDDKFTPDDHTHQSHLVPSHTDHYISSPFDDLEENVSFSFTDDLDVDKNINQGQGNVPETKYLDPFYSSITLNNNDPPRPNITEYSTKSTSDDLFTNDFGVGETDNNNMPMNPIAMGDNLYDLSYLLSETSFEHELGGFTDYDYLNHFITFEQNYHTMTSTQPSTSTATETAMDIGPDVTPHDALPEFRHHDVVPFHYCSENTSRRTDTEALLLLREQPPTSSTAGYYNTSSETILNYNNTSTDTFLMTSNSKPTSISNGRKRCYSFNDAHHTPDKKSRAFSNYLPFILDHETKAERHEHPKWRVTCQEVSRSTDEKTDPDDLNVNNITSSASALFYTSSAQPAAAFSQDHPRPFTAGCTSATANNDIFSSFMEHSNVDNDTSLPQSFRSIDALERDKSDGLAPISYPCYQRFPSIQEGQHLSVIDEMTQPNPCLEIDGATVCINNSDNNINNDWDKIYDSNNNDITEYHVLQDTAKCGDSSENHPQVTNTQEDNNDTTTDSVAGGPSSMTVSNPEPTETDAEDPDRPLIGGFAPGQPETDDGQALDPTTCPDDPALKRAFREFQRTGKTSPLIKEELRRKILYKLCLEGKEEITPHTQLEPSTSPHPLTEEEEKKRTRRRELNKIAAAKSRQRRKVEKNVTTGTLHEEEDRNNSLKDKLERMRSEKVALLHHLSVLGVPMNFKLTPR